jgi:hypothetical protein
VAQRFDQRNAPHHELDWMEHLTDEQYVKSSRRLVPQPGGG